MHAGWLAGAIPSAPAGAACPGDQEAVGALGQRSGNAVDREEILSDVWGDAADVSSNVVDVVVRSLRKKLAERADVIETISGFGYRLCDNEANE